MTLDIGLVLAISAIAMTLFMTERLRMDMVAIVVLISLSVLNLIDPAEALSGFSNQATITVLAMFILAAGLQNTGALSEVGQLLGKSQSPTTFLLTLFGVLAVIAPFVNNTAVVAVFMPVVIAASLKINLPPTKSLIPLSYVSQMVGVCTLIGTSTNLIVNSIAQDLGHQGFSMFQFLPLGAICAGAGCLYLLTIGRWLLPKQGQAEFSAGGEGGNYVTELQVTEDSKLIDESIETLGIHNEFNVYVLELWREDQKLWSPRAETLQKNDILLVRGKWERLYDLKDAMGLAFTAESNAPADMREHQDKDEDEEEDKTDKRIMAEIMISPNSMIIGHGIHALDRRMSDDISILGIQRRGHVLRERLDETVIRIGDILLMLMPESHLNKLRQNKHFIILSEQSEPVGRSWRKPFALLVMGAVVLLPVLGVLPIAISALAGATVMVISGCLNLDDMYEAVDWRIIFLMAGLLPLGSAMSTSGAAGFLVDNSIAFVHDLGPHIVLAVLYLMALLLGELMSNSAAAVLLTPIGMSTAQMMEADATPFLIAITFSASTSFLTPVGYQTNTMVYGAGGYKFTDFVKVGLPLNMIFWVLGVIFIPIFWPF